MISKLFNDLTNNEGMTIPSDYRAFLEKNKDNLYDWAFKEIFIDDNEFIFNNFLGETGELNTDLMMWYKFMSNGSEYLIFGNGIYGESYAIKTKGDKIGQVAVFFDDDGEREQVVIAKSFSDFLSKLK